VPGTDSYQLVPGGADHHAPQFKRLISRPKGCSMDVWRRLEERKT
jgi:hypothetical protein